MLSEMRKKESESGSVSFRSVGRLAIRSVAIRLTWMPGMRPVMIPQRIPMEIAMVKVIIFFRVLLFQCIFSFSRCRILLRCRQFQG